MEVVEGRLYLTETSWPLAARPDNYKEDLADIEFSRI